MSIAKCVGDKKRAYESEQRTKMVIVLHDSVDAQPRLFLFVAVNMKNHPVAFRRQNVIKIIRHKCNCANNANS